ncbi:hypothetical protein A3C26_04295 [Candidatus Daviesbacteria bacterium RIFCSPHIGHO2_02_FULL_39_12]|uniref:Guanylate kinase-like domain-containing protein n=2 Tax=Candidatus Daviesiibacteriota TaxID=1752718 RepID=A0A1F5JDB2_9BACT|nr:MAG: hypothetical protein A3C26_04295 [Candidatus Daviesbacteria bacterium RIFCSPHIGHO2_02_FULL_39_12]OGE71587.1 MAG: hypothetical protein A3H40_03915 [Candidatus Daviesbacteria bacterium RIFCSPLOWO2_02_FULL_38_15]
MENSGLLLILTGKTASGKDTIMQMLLSKYPNLQRVTTSTSRPKRDNEKDGLDYYFLTGEEFNKKIGKGDFIEHVEYGGHLYGTEKTEIAKVFNTNLIWRIDPSRASQIRQFIKSANVLVIYLTVSDQVILERLQKRGLSQAEIQTRMQQDKIFWNQFKDSYDFVVENVPGKLNQTFNKIAQIIESHRSKQP